ncbi:hypothetical protein L3Q82_004263 [Scortum barcoo]|uniref:Uncharacterized protein n=1 Tax=Scortum barcoo TaxID=214431 RepID=A0ACB8VJM2_9TELE|nr:hypothetical protein L3Q82_004263 [Scortum barcoo]
MTLEVLLTGARLKTNKGDAAFEVALPMWNALPVDVQCAASADAFKKQLKTHLFKLAFVSPRAVRAPQVVRAVIDFFTRMAVFDSCSVLLELKNLAFKEKKLLKSAITDNGGNISFVINKQCSLIVTSDVSNLSPNRLRSIQKYQTPVVGVDYVHTCLQRGVLLPVDEYKLDIPSSSVFSPPPPPLSLQKSSPLSHQEFILKLTLTFHLLRELLLITVISLKGNGKTWCVLELQSAQGEEGRQYRVVRYWKDDIGAKKAAVRDKLLFLSTSEEALEVYKSLRETLLTSGLQLRQDMPAQAGDLGSAPLQQLLLEEKLNTGSLSQEVGVFVELLWTEALGCLNNILRVPIDKLSLNDVSRVEGLLLQAQKKLRDADPAEAASLLNEVYTLLPHREPPLSPTAKGISQKLDLCQLIRDVLSVSEMTLGSPVPSCLGKYRALRCSIEAVDPSSSEFQAVTALLQDSSKTQIKQVLRVSRGVELQTFKSELGNIKPLLHSSSPSNFVGLLSRGLLLPRVGVELHGIERTDVGNLGSGIYFSDALSTSLKYAKPSVTDGSRLLLVCDVALGLCKDVHKKDFSLTQAPEGHHSVHGVRHTPNAHSEFEDDEYVVYSPDQVKLKYVVQFSVEGNKQIEFRPAIDTSAELCPPSADQELCLEDDAVEDIKNPLDNVKAGLLDSSGEQLPLQGVHVKCKLMDLLSQVIIFQKYTNLSAVPIEAKYVFPLDDSAAVCGFEAFINGKHVVGQVKEKETARKEYKQAIERGHGAYLMDQDAPDVFTISVGNLPPGATVLIKVTFVSELIVRDGSIFFSLPGSVAPWQESAALNQTTQVTVEKVCVSDETASTREFTLDMSIEMPYEISSLECITHKVKIKRTDCKAVVSVLPGEVMGAEGFQLSVTLSEVHLPRMWVEKHPDKDSQACMLVFYPDFDVDSGSAHDEVVLLLDTSESMKGESLHTARRIALQVLKKLDSNLRVNVIFFGTDHTETFLTAQPLVEARHEVESFIKGSSPVGGSTELWRPLRALSLLPPSRGVRNLLLLSDGHIQNAELTLKLLKENAQHSRVFTCGLSPTANRHMLRALAQAGGGAFEFFDTKTKHNWAEKVACQVKRMTSPGCSSVSVKWQQFNPTAPPPVQAPKQLHALFNDCHTLVYGFVPHCTQATLLGNLSGQELKTMVSSSELQKTRGTFLHKLTARALIRDYEDGNLDSNEAEHEGKKAELKRFIIDLSKEFSILSQFTSFVAIEERDSEQTEEGFTDIPKLIAEEDVDFLPYISWITAPENEEEEVGERSSSSSECSSMQSLSTEKEDMSFSEERKRESDDDMVFAPPPSSSFFRPPAPSAALRLQRRPIIKRAPIIAGDEFLDLGLIGAKGPEVQSSPAPPPPRLLSFGASIQKKKRKGRGLEDAGFEFATPSPAPLPPPPLVDGYLQNLGLAPELASPMATTAGLYVEARMRQSPMGYGLTNQGFGFTTPSPAPPPPPPPRPVNCYPQSLKRFSPKPPSPTAATAGLYVPVSLRQSLGGEDGLREEDFGFATPSPAPPPPPPNLPGLASFSFSLTPQWVSQSEEETTGIFDMLESSHSVIYPEPVFPFGQSAKELLGTAEPPAQMEILRRLPMSLSACSEPAHLVSSGMSKMMGSSADPEALKLRWAKIFQLQNSEGYWELTTELGELINVDVDVFANVFLKKKGIHSLGVKASEDILRLVATLLVLQLMRMEKLEEGKLLRTLFCLDDPSGPRPERWVDVKRAVDWVRWADRQYPCVYSRLEFGLSWESSTRQLLGFEDLPPFSSLSGRRSSERRFHGVIILLLGLLSVFLLAGLIGLAVHYHYSVHVVQLQNSPPSESNLTEHLQESNTKLVSSIEERDQLKANLTEMTKELTRLQSLSKQKLVLQDGGCSVVPVISFPLRLLLGNKADETAENKGADLVVIESYEEQKFLTDFIKKFTWIGLNDREKEGVWKWIDETPLTQASDFLCHIFPQYERWRSLNAERSKPVELKPSTTQSGRRSSERRFHGVIIILLLGLLSVFLLAGLIGLAVHYHYSVRGSAAELSTIRANLTERLQESNTKLVSAIEERDQLKANLTEMTEELKRLQSLSKQNRTCPAGWRMLSCTCYFFSTTSASWEQSRRDCRDKGADLVVIESYEEQELLTKIIKKDTWIGLNDREKEGVWKWIDETPLTQAYWWNRKPDNGGVSQQWGEEDCVKIIVGMKMEENWNDRQCEDSLQWICEKLP